MEAVQQFSSSAVQQLGGTPIESPRVGAVCNLKMDDNLKLVMEFMQSNMAASKLVGVVQALAAVAPVMWGQYEREEVRALVLSAPPIRSESLQSVATV